MFYKWILPSRYIRMSSVKRYSYQLEFPRVKQWVPSIIRLLLIFCLRPLSRYKRCSQSCRIRHKSLERTLIYEFMRFTLLRVQRSVGNNYETNTIIIHRTCVCVYNNQQIADVCEFFTSTYRHEIHIYIQISPEYVS